MERRNESGVPYECGVGGGRLLLVVGVGTKFLLDLHARARQVELVSASSVWPCAQVNHYCHAQSRLPVRLGATRVSRPPTRSSNLSC